MTAGKMVGGLALGGVAGVAAFGGSAIVGRGVGWTAQKAASVAHGAGKANVWGTGKLFDKAASGLTGVGALAQRSSFDIRGVKVGGRSLLAGATGLHVGEAQQGGIAQSRKEKVEKRMKRADQLKVREDEGLKQDLNKTEADLQSLLVENAKVIEHLDKAIEKARQDASDAEKEFKAGIINEDQLRGKTEALGEAKLQKEEMVNGRPYRNSSGDIVTAGGSIKALEDQKKTQAQAIKVENARRTTAFANRTTRVNRWSRGITKGVTSAATLFLTKGIALDLGSNVNNEAAHKIIMESKIESKGEGH